MIIRAGQVVLRYIQRHWRGELSLARSFWVNCILFNLVFGIVKTVFLATYEEDGMAVYRIRATIFLGQLLVYPWQVIGLWRACVAHIHKYHCFFWARVAQGLVAISVLWTAIVLVLFAPVFQHLLYIAYMMEPTEHYTFTVVNDGAVLQFDGEYVVGVSKAFKEMLNDHPQIRAVILKTPGGLADEGFRMAEIINERQLDTYVTDYCFSAGTFSFVAGNNRNIVIDACLGFHQCEFSLAKKIRYGDKFSSFLAREYANHEKNKEALFVNQGVTKDFIERINSVPHDDMWYPTVHELLEAGVIHGVVDADLKPIDMAEKKRYSENLEWLKTIMDRWDSQADEIDHFGEIVDCNEID